MDYGFCSLYSMASVIPTAYFAAYGWSAMQRTALIIVCITVQHNHVQLATCVGVTAQYVAIKSRQWGYIRYIVRFVVYGCCWFTVNTPFLIRYFTSHDETRDRLQQLGVNNEVYWLGHFLSYFFGGLIMTVKFPERLAPGKFDYGLTSHVLWHIFGTILGSYSQYKAFMIDYNSGAWTSTVSSTIF